MANDTDTENSTSSSGSTGSNGNGGSSSGSKKSGAKSGRSATRSASSKAGSSARRSSSAGSKSGSRSGSGRSSKSGGNSGNSGNGGIRRNIGNVPVPSWATTVASLVGVGVALGFGLFATRSRWMPYAEDVNERLHDRWDEMNEQRASGDDDEGDDFGDFDADDDSEWADTGVTTAAGMTPGGTGYNPAGTTGL